MERAQIDWNIEVKHRKLAKKYYKETEIISILKQLSQGLYFLQKNKIAHRDIKPQNILIFPNNIYKIADMGEAKEIDKNRMQIATLRGSELFMSPLLYEGLKYNKKNIRHNPYKSDMFSLGLCFLYAICLNLKVLEYIREMKDMNSIKSILNKFLDKNIYSNKLIEIIYRMIDLQEEKRFDFEELEKELSKF
jgi:translation initiation factor 2-alpha kinase 4